MSGCRTTSAQDTRNGNATGDVKHQVAWLACNKSSDRLSDTLQAKPLPTVTCSVVPLRVMPSCLMSLLCSSVAVRPSRDRKLATACSAMWTWTSTHEKRRLRKQVGRLHWGQHGVIVHCHIGCTTHSPTESVTRHSTHLGAWLLQVAHLVWAADRDKHSLATVLHKRPRLDTCVETVVKQERQIA